MSTARNVWKYFKWTAIGLTGLLLALVVFLLVWIDPNDYRDDITTLVKDKSGLVLKIDGNIGWSFYPAIGFSVENVSLAASEETPAIISVGKTMVSVELLPLFSRQINVRTLFVDKAVANLVMDANGKGNWEALSAGSSTEPEPAPEPETAGEALLVNVPKVVITNTIIDYEDQKSLAHQTVTIKEFVAEDIGLAREFPLHLVATLADRSGLNADIDTRAFVTLDTDAQRYAVRAMELKGTIAGILKQPIRLNLTTDLVADLGVQKIAVTALDLTAAGLDLGPAPLTARLNGPLAMDLAADTAVVGPLTFGISALEGGLQVNVKDVSKEPGYSGTLSLNPFNAKNLMRDFGVTAPVTTDPLAMTRVALKTAFEGTKTRAMLNNLDITLDDTHIRGNAGVTDVATTALAFDLNVDAINADRYLPPPAKPAAAPASAPAAATAAAKKAEPLLPVDTLRTLNIDGKLAIGKMTLMELPMTAIAATVKAKDGDIHLDPFTAGVLEGTVRGKVRVDARGAEPHIVTNLKLDKIEVGGLVKRFAGKDLFMGKTSLNLDLDTTGNDVDTLLKKAVGGLDLSFANATLKGMNLNNMLSETLTQQLGAFSMLVPDYQSKLPQELQQDTVFSTLATAAKIKDGIAQIPSFNAGVKDGAVKGSGQFNIVSKDFDYTLAMRTDKLKDSKYFTNAEFPVRCKGNITGSPASWCRPDSKAIGDMLKKTAESAVKDRVKTELANKLGLDPGALGSGTEIKEEVKKEAKKQAKEKVNKELENALKKYF